MPSTSSDTLDKVREYYGKTLQTKDDLKTGACCSADAMPPHVRAVLPLIDREVVEKFYGCGSPIPLELAGRTVLDLGCGTGRDVFLVSKLVGAEGSVIGVDMTDEQLAVARTHAADQAKRFGYAKPNTDFRQGFIEDLQSVGLADASVDVVISNCVINLSPEKRRVFSEILRVLKPGGELYFSDIFADRRIPESMQADPVLRGECLSGALYVEDFRRMMAELGCPDYRIVARSPVALHDALIKEKLGMIAFHSLTIRLFKIPSLEDRCEDYGQAAIYRGSLAESPHAFVLDEQHTFEAGRVVPVCGNTAAMLDQTRFANHFKVLGDRTTHLGSFDCTSPLSGNDGKAGDGSCC